VGLDSVIQSRVHGFRSFGQVEVPEPQTHHTFTKPDPALFKTCSVFESFMCKLMMLLTFNYVVN
jgi:hypothetical protein